MSEEQKPVHSPLGASSYSRWGQCPGSVKLCKDIPNVSSVYADEGSLAHSVAEGILRSLLFKIPYELPKDLPEDMLDAVLVYVEFVKMQASVASELKLEQRFDLSRYYPNLYGTADCVVYVEHLKLLHVIDYKHGAGVAVEAAENKQLLYYALGALNEFKEPVEKIKLTIVQPRCFHPEGPIRSCEVETYRLTEFLIDLILDAKATQAPDAPLIAGDHCRWCLAKATCPEIHKKALSLAQNAFTPDFSYDPQLLAKTLDGLSMIEDWAKGVRAFAYAEAQRGHPPPGYKLVAKRANRKWKIDNEKEMALVIQNVLPGIQEQKIFDYKLKSPAQIEKLVDKQFKSALQGLVIQESSGTTLVKDVDSRKAFKDSAADVFDIVPQ